MLLSVYKAILSCWSPRRNRMWVTLMHVFLMPMTSLKVPLGDYIRRYLAFNILPSEFTVLIMYFHSYRASSSLSFCSRAGFYYLRISCAERNNYCFISICSIVSICVQDTRYLLQCNLLRLK